MRMTVTIGDNLYRSAKAHAAITGQSVGSVIEDALRDLLARAGAAAAHVPNLPVYDMELLPGVPYDDNSALEEYLDEGGCADDHAAPIPSGRTVVDTSATG